jgi:hypothetical protein
MRASRIEEIWLTRIGIPYIGQVFSLDLQPGKDSMPRHSAPVLIALLASLLAPASAHAQLTPPAGSAGAGNSAINGIPFGPANPRVLSDPSGIGNASRMPPLGTNSPPPAVAYGPIGSAPSRAVAPYAGGASQRIFSADEVVSKRRPIRRRGRPQVSKFTGICRGC